MAEPAHADRGHATWSASASARNWGCPGAIAMALRLNRAETESIHAARGTACHEVSEKALRSGKACLDYLGDTVATKQHAIEVDEEIVNTAQEYVDYVLSRIDRDSGSRKPLQIEQHFSLADLGPPFDAGGTGDAVIHHAFDRHLEIVDLKGGMGVVDVRENKQLRTYALGALLANPTLEVDTVTVTIVQPRAPHKDGRIRSETFHVADLVEWTVELLGAMAVSAEAKKALDDGMPWAAWWSTYLKAGSHCTFCPAEGNCPAQDQKALDAVGVWFDDQTVPHVANTPDQLGPDALAEKLDMLDMIEGWVKAVRAYAHGQAEAGVAIPGYQLSEKIGNRKWAADEEKVFHDLIAVAGLTEDQAVTKKVRSPAQIEKVLGAKRKNLIDNMWVREVTGTNLVATAKTNRPAVKSKPELYFQQPEE